MTDLKLFKRNLQLRIICDRSKEGLGAVLQQKSEEGRETTHFVSLFYTKFEKQYSINKLEGLAVVWSIENF